LICASEIKSRAAVCSSLFYIFIYSLFYNISISLIMASNFKNIWRVMIWIEFAKRLWLINMLAGRKWGRLRSGVATSVPNTRLMLNAGSVLPAKCVIWLVWCKWLSTCLPPWRVVNSGEGWHEWKAKFVPVYVMRAYTGSRGVTPRILNLDTRGERGQIHAPTALPPWNFVAPTDHDSGWSPIVDQKSYGKKNTSHVPTGIWTPGPSSP
jgi:hypothetical protein